MNKTDAYFHRLAITKPFASGVDAILTPIANTAGEDSSVNFNDGFPAAYSAPKSNNGKYITRGEMNAIGNLASQNQFYFMAGGINTFDQDFCNAIGGYPQGAILNYLDGDKLLFVESLMDGNTNNFVINGVDGVSWRLLVTPTDESQVNSIFFQGGRNAGIGRSILGTVKAKQTGAITVSDTFKLILSGSQYALGRYGGMGTGNWMGFVGCSLAIKDLGISLPSGSSIEMPVYTIGTTSSASTINWNDWTSLSGNYSIAGFWNQSVNQSPYATVEPMPNFTGFVEIGHYYMIAILSSAIANVVFYGSGTDSDGYDNNTAVAISASEITGEALLAYS